MSVKRFLGEPLARLGNVMDDFSASFPKEKLLSTAMKPYTRGNAMTAFPRSGIRNATGSEPYPYC